jgi:hypothetical protein
MITWLKEKLSMKLVRKFSITSIISSAGRNKSQTILTFGQEALQQLLDEGDVVKSKLDKFRQFESVKSTQTVDLEFTFESNRLEGNTLIARNGTCYQSRRNYCW